MFFRKKTKAEKRPVARTGAAEETRLKELRVKARQRLVGALVLVVTAFILVTWLFDDPATEPAPAPIVVPAPPVGLAPDSEFSAISPPDDTPEDIRIPEDTDQDPLVGTEPATPAATDSPDTDTTERPATQPPSEAPVDSTPAAQPAPRSETSSKPAPDRSQDTPRTDDGSVALALLSGKAPPSTTDTPKPAATGRYTLQVAAYTNEQDALKRRDTLREAGVSNAYVETAQSGGRTVHRLRVGPFSSHEAAQAAQTRLRALGYENGLIAGQ